jgi:hypothetical protein
MILRSTSLLCRAAEARTLSRYWRQNCLMGKYGVFHIALASTFILDCMQPYLLPVAVCRLQHRASGDDRKATSRAHADRLRPTGVLSLSRGRTGGRGHSGRSAADSSAGRQAATQQRLGAGHHTFV